MEDLTGQVDTVDSITAAEWNNLQQEFKNFIEAFVTMNVGDLTQLRKVGTSMSAQAQWTESSGGTVAYTLAMNTGILAPVAYATGQVFQFRPNANNTVGSNTVNVGGLGAKDIVREDLTALQAADLATTRDAIIRYDGTRFLLLDHTLAADAADFPQRHIWGLTMGHNPAETTTFQDIEVAVGECRDRDNAQNLVAGTSIIKKFDASFAFGTNAGGYPVTTLGARATDTWYRFFIIGRSTTGAVDFGFDSEANDDATALLTDANTAQGDSTWTRYRQLGWVKTTAGSALALVPFQNNPDAPDEFLWTGLVALDDPLAGTALSSGVLSRVTYTTAWAPIDSVLLSGWHAFNKSSSNFAAVSGIITPLLYPDVAPTTSLGTLHNGDPGTGGGAGSTPLTAVRAHSLGQNEVQLSATKTYHARWATEGSGVYVYDRVRGFRFHREK